MMSINYFGINLNSAMSNRRLDIYKNLISENCAAFCIKHVVISSYFFVIQFTKTNNENMRTVLVLES